MLKTKSDQNTHLNASNCTTLTNFLGGTCPRTPLAKRMTSKSEKKYCPPPPKSWLRHCLEHIFR